MARDATITLDRRSRIEEARVQRLIGTGVRHVRHRGQGVDENNYDAPHNDATIGEVIIRQSRYGEVVEQA